MIRKFDHDRLFNFRNIADRGSFIIPPGKQLEDFDAKLHMFDYQAQHWIVGIDATIEILKSFKSTHWLGVLLSVPGIYQIARLKYALFARLRVYLPKRRSCAL